MKYGSRCSVSTSRSGRTAWTLDWESFIGSILRPTGPARNDGSSIFN